MSSRQYSRLCGPGPFAALVLVVLGALTGCSETAPPALDQTWSGICIDQDSDGFGFQCGLGSDCDDSDSTRHDTCLKCQQPNEGCECDEGVPAVDCSLPHALDDSGALICRSGTRYCRDSRWSACEGVASFVVPAARSVSARARVDRNLPAVPCTECTPDCFLLDDPLTAQGDAGAGPGLIYTPNGITLAFDAPDGSVADAGVLPPPYVGIADDEPCDTALDGDCDGLPNFYDAEPVSTGPHHTLFYPLAPGEEATRTLQSPISIRIADVYFYLDATGSMEDQRDRLIADLHVGNFLPNGGIDTTCADVDGNGAPDDALKTQGIVGNLACLAPSVQFGAGFFRDIPFMGPSAVDGQRVGPADNEMFEHRLDLSSDFARLDSTLSAIDVRDNYNVPEGGMQGLWALATGQELYAGWNRPGIPARRGCPSNTWGYPCFRDAAMPLVLQITDAPMQNGPPTRGTFSTNPVTPANCLSNAFEYMSGVSCAPLMYDSQVLAGLSAGSESSYRSLNASAESLADPQRIGSIDDVLVTYTGDTRGMAADITYENLGFACADLGLAGWNGGQQQDAPDAVFAFTVGRAGSYLVSARGSRFDTSLMLLRADAAGVPTSIAGCADDSLPVVDDVLQHDHDAELQRFLAVGNYIVVLKGYENGNAGMFQLTVGRSSLQQTGAFAAKQWSGAGGVQEVLTDAAMRVITVQPGYDRYARDQARRLATATGAIDSSGRSISALMDADNTIGDEIVDTIGRTLSNTSMTVSLRLVQAAGDPDPELPIVVRAVEWPGDGCSPPVDLNQDGILDAHTNCRRGSRPRFDLTIRNLPGAGLAPNPDDPSGQGGYRMLVQVLGDGRFVLDEYPVYIAPLAGMASPPLRVAGGSYEELVESKGCAPGERPSWRTQYWQATLPPDTRALFQMCSGNTEDEARACTPVDVAQLNPAGTCSGTQPADCGTTGYCSNSLVCHDVTGADCLSDDQCGAYGLCNMVGTRRACTFSRSAADLKALPPAIQGKRFAKVRIELHPNPARTQAPIVHDWKLDYICAPSN